MKNNTNMSIVYTCALIFVLTILMLACTPKKVSSENGNINLISVLGNSKKIPIHDITETMIPNDGKLIRTCGLHAGSRMSGYYKIQKTKQKVRLFVTGKREKRSFEYKGATYIVDDWTQ